MTSVQANRLGTDREPAGSLLFTMGAIFPGAGQFVQKRWLAAMVYAASSVAGVVGFVACGLRFFYSYYSDTSWDGSGQGIAVVWPYVFKMLLFLAVTILIWLVSSIDLYISHSRRKRKLLLASMHRKPTSPPPM